jgi:hypothetical protein
VGDQSSIAWTDATCRPCGAVLNNVNTVELGRRLCKPCKNARQRTAYIKRGRPGRRGWLAATRDGDKLQARRRVNYLVEQGIIPRAEDLPCFDCADEVFSRRYRHEYDHARGYDGENQLYVEPVCAKCHRNREEARRGGVAA